MVCRNHRQVCKSSDKTEQNRTEQTDAIGCRTITSTSISFPTFIYSKNVHLIASSEEIHHGIVNSNSSSEVYRIFQTSECWRRIPFLEATEVKLGLLR